MQFSISNIIDKKIFFIGVGGISMSALALFLKNMNFTVGGSDVKDSKELEYLKTKDVKVFTPHNENNVLGYDVVVYTSAISENNPELLKAKSMGLRLIKRSELLGMVANLYKNSIAVCGSHGKTTTSSLLYCAFNSCKLSPTAFIGGISDNISNYQKGSYDYLILEACEYKKNFLDIKPKVSVVLNIDDDHVDTFLSEKDRFDTFSSFTKNTLCFYNKDNINENVLKAKKLISFGLNKDCDYTAVNIRKNGLGYSFTVRNKGKNIIRINLKILGRHNVYNALACACVSHYFGLNLKDVKTALESFNGVDRRNEFLGKYLGVKVYADYAHHPTEIKAYLKARKDTLDDSIVVFQPHTYSRTKALKEKFISSLLGEHELIIYKTYPAREKYDYKGSAISLYKSIKIVKENTRYAKDEKQLLSLIKNAIRGKENLLILGAGDVYELIKNFIN